MIVNGINSIQETLRHIGGFAGPRKPGVDHTLTRLYVPAGPVSPRVHNLLIMAEKVGVTVEKMPENAFRSMLVKSRIDEGEGFHQGVLAEIEGLETHSAATIDYTAVNSIFVVLDGITDPHNMGAIIRTAAFYGCSGILVPEDRSARMGPAVYKVASGGLEYVPVYSVANLPKSVAKMQQMGHNIIGLSEHSDKALDTVTRESGYNYEKLVLVVGSEERGIRPAIKSLCDTWVSISGQNHLSLNASVAFAAAITTLYQKTRAAETA